MHAKSLQSCLTLCPMDVARQAPLSMGFSRQEYWSGLPGPLSGDVPDPGIELVSLKSNLRWLVDYLPQAPPGKPLGSQLFFICCALHQWALWKGSCLDRLLQVTALLVSLTAGEWREPRSWRATSTQSQGTAPGSLFTNPSGLHLTHKVHAQGKLKVLVTQSCPTLCNPMDHSPLGSSVHGVSPGKNTGVGCQALLQRIFRTQGSNSGLPHCRWIFFTV